MASYQLIKEAGDERTSHLRAKDSTLCIESATFQKMNPPSPRMRKEVSGTGVSSDAPARLASLDVFRGLTVALMIFVDTAGGIFPMINHSPWNGLTLADFVMPFFLFMVGVSLGLVCKNVPDRSAATRKAMWRTGKLLILGLFLQGGYFHGINSLTYGVDLMQIRWMGILQRIAAAYWVGAMCEIWLRNDEKVISGVSLFKKYRWHWTVAFILTSIYLLLLYGLYVPDWEYQTPYGASTGAKILKVKCGVRGDTGPSCNAAGMIDRMILGIQHLYRKPIYARTKQCSINSPDYGPLPPNAPSWCGAPYDPEGLVSTLMAIVTCLVGLQYGHIIVYFKDHKQRIWLWLVTSLLFVFVGTLCATFGMHINKALYSLSYTCVTIGVGGIVFATTYLVVDIYRWSGSTMVLKWMGTNALLLYVVVACNVLPLVLQGFYWTHPRCNIMHLIGIKSNNH